MPDRAFEDTVKKLLGMKPKPHKKGEGQGGEPEPAPKAGSDEQKPDLDQHDDETKHRG